jgi:hypothetical protein
MTSMSWTVLAHVHLCAGFQTSVTHHYAIVTHSAAKMNYFKLIDATPMCSGSAFSDALLYIWVSLETNATFVSPCNCTSVVLHGNASVPTCIGATRPNTHTVCVMPVGSDFSLNTQHFPIIYAVCFLTSIVSLVGFAYCYCRRGGVAKHRLFVFIASALSCLIRGMYFAYFSSKIDAALYESNCDGSQLIKVGQLARHSLLPIQAFSDLLYSCVDVLLTFFWSQLLAGSSVFPTCRCIVAVVFISAAGVTGILLDYLKYSRDWVDNNSPLSRVSVDEVFPATLIIVGVVLIFTSILHIATAARVAVSFWVGDNRIDAARSFVLRVGVIASVTSLISMFRGTVILARVLTAHSTVDTFKSGALSFNNHTFTFVYYVALVNLPAIVIVACFVRFPSLSEVMSTAVDALERIGSVLHYGSEKPS